jgi:hypothetical protein
MMNIYNQSPTLTKTILEYCIQKGRVIQRALFLFDGEVMLCQVRKVITMINRLLI